MKKILFAVLLVAFVASAFDASAIEIRKGDNFYVDMRIFIQPWAQLTQRASPDIGSYNSDFYLRRMRLMFSGSVTKSVDFFVDTDIANFGKGQNTSERMFVQDAYVEFPLMDEFKPSIGMILLPFSHNNLQSSGTLNTLDFHTSVIKFPVGNNLYWRDMGVQLRGLFLEKHIEYRAGMFNGTRGKLADDATTTGYDDTKINPQGTPRYTGRMQFNLLDPEDKFFYGGNYLSKKKIISFGGGFDYQRKAVIYDSNTFRDYAAWVADLFVDYPLDDNMNLVFQTNFFNYDYGKSKGKINAVDANGNEKLVSPAFGAPAVPVAMKGPDGAYPGQKTGQGYFVEMGLRYEQYEPVISYERYEPKYNDVGLTDYTENIRVGFNYWIKEHATSVKIEYANIKTKVTPTYFPTNSIYTVQTQLLF